MALFSGPEKIVSRRFHYAWVVAGITFVALLAAAGVRTAPGVFITLMEQEFGWSRASISFAVAVSLIAFGLGGPFGGSLVDRFGPRWVMAGGLALIAAGLLPMLWMTSLWELNLYWGIVAGVGTGMVATVLGATVAQRWFKAHRGLMVGLFSAAASAGQLIFLPSLMQITTASGWRTGIWLMAVVLLALVVPAALLMRDSPEKLGLRPFGDEALPEAPRPTGSPAAAALPVEAPAIGLAQAARTRDFWLLAGSFFICGYTSNGLVGTHLIPHALECGFTTDVAASAFAVMGAMNVIGTLASGWLSDRFDNRLLLACYYGFRAIAIATLPFITENIGLFAFAVLYGLDWIATVPPTVNLTARRFGRASLGQIFGWIFCAHMIGAAVAAYAGGALHDVFGNYTLTFLSAAVLGFIAVGLSLGVQVRSGRAAVGAVAPAPLR
jgi:sugar phosphate permease